MNTDTQLDALLVNPNLLPSEREAITRLLAVTAALEALALPTDSNLHLGNSNATSVTDGAALASAVGGDTPHRRSP